jgi:hypothetical protein
VKKEKSTESFLNLRKDCSSGCYKEFQTINLHNGISVCFDDACDCVLGRYEFSRFKNSKQSFLLFLC